MTINYEQVLAEAHAAAAEAVADARDEWACGFAWVLLDGNEPLARFCRAQAKAQPSDDYTARRYFGGKGYPKGWQFWQPGNFWGQSVAAHEKGSVAFRDVLATYGIRAEVCSRLD